MWLQASSTAVRTSKLWPSVRGAYRRDLFVHARTGPSDKPPRTDKKKGGVVTRGRKQAACTAFRGRNSSASRPPRTFPPSVALLQASVLLPASCSNCIPRRNSSAPKHFPSFCGFTTSKALYYFPTNKSAFTAFRGETRAPPRD